mmetsp:Transcript_46217/g.67841  ORF Transcript_46217/g.67841 Transcript_46217/m.67841 type:complete len:100 (+) Transcript_46217:1088-1387(+)
MIPSFLRERGGALRAKKAREVCTAKLDTQKLDIIQRNLLTILETCRHISSAVLHMYIYTYLYICIYTSSRQVHVYITTCNNYYFDDYYCVRRMVVRVYV